MKRKLKQLSRKAAKLLKNVVLKLQKSSQGVKDIALLVLQGLSIILLVAAISIACGRRPNTKTIERKVADSVLMIKSLPESSIHGSGTAFEIKAASGKVYTITNAHVCDLGYDGKILVEDKLHSRRFIPKRILEVYADNDLCLIEGMENYPALEIAESVESSQHIWAVGYPMGEGLNISEGRIKGFGVVQVSADKPLNECKGLREHIVNIPTFFGDIPMCLIDRDAIQTDMLIYPGNSGSPMTNDDGEVVGVVFASNNLTHWGDSVPLTDIIKLLKAY